MAETVDAEDPQTVQKGAKQLSVSHRHDEEELRGRGQEDEFLC